MLGKPSVGFCFFMQLSKTREEDGGRSRMRCQIIVHGTTKMQQSLCCLHDLERLHTNSAHFCKCQYACIPSFTPRKCVCVCVCGCCCCCCCCLKCARSYGIEERVLRSVHYYYEETRHKDLSARLSGAQTY